jgi:hypothetical protein
LAKDYGGLTNDNAFHHINRTSYRHCCCNHRNLSRRNKREELKMTYVIAIRKNDGTINPMLTGRTYAPIAARMRAEQLNRERQAELVALGAESFVAFNLGAE